MLVSLQSRNRVIEEVNLIEEEIRYHFKTIFRAPSGGKANLNNLIFYALSQEDSEGLEEQFAKEEIKKVIFECHGDKSSGPDGFNLLFIKNFWNIVGEDFVDFIKEFHRIAKLHKALTAHLLR